MHSLEGQGNVFCMTNYQKELEVALAIVARASQLCARVQSKLVTEDTLAKKDKSPVTVADFGAQALILDVLSQEFPDDGCVAEEDADALASQDNAVLCDQVLSVVTEFAPQTTQTSMLNAIRRGAGAGGGTGRFWTLDPIDGTKGFLRKEQYAVALALIEDGEVVLGVLGCPNLPLQPDCSEGAVGCLFYAVRGEGAFMRGLSAGAQATQVHVSTDADIAEACLCESVESGHTKHDTSADIANALGIVKSPVRMDSQCKYGALARGQASIYLRLPTRPGYVERIWDHAAGALIVTEAGGVVCDVNGKPLDFSQGRGLERNRGVIATTPAYASKVVETVSRSLDI